MNVKEVRFDEASDNGFSDEWEWSSIGAIADVKGGKRLPKGADYAHGVTDHAYVRVTDFEDLSVNASQLRYITPEIHRKIARYVISSHDVYISIAGTIGLVGTVPNELNGANLTENAARIIVQDSNIVFPRFLAYWLSSHQGQAEIRVRATKTSQPKLALMRIKQLPIPLPPLAEQRRIAAVLNAIQDAIAAQQDVIAAARELKRSLMHRLFTYGPGREPAETKETEIGVIPEHWEINKIGELASVTSGTTPSRKNPDYWRNGTIPWVKTGEIAYCRIDSTEERVTEIALNNTSLRLYPAGTLLLAMYGQGITRGKVGVLGIDSAINQACAAITPTDSRVQIPYLYHYLAYAYDRLRDQSHGTHQLNLSGRLVKEFEIPLASALDQGRIDEALSSADDKLASEEDRLASLHVLFKSMLHQLMTGQIRLLHDDGLPIAEEPEHVG